MNRALLVRVSLVGWLGWAVFAVVPSYAQQAAPVCTENTRACMIATAQTYFDGLAAHDGSRIPFAPGARRTEIGRSTGDDDESMRLAIDLQPDLTVSGTRWFVDESTHNVIGFTLLRLAGGNADPDRPSHATSDQSATTHLAERFKVVDGLIREVEAIFFIEFGNPKGTSGWGDSMPLPTQRPLRELFQSLDPRESPGALEQPQ